MNILLNYLDINLKWKNDKPIFKFIIKSDKKITNEFPLKCIVNNKRVSKTGESYYIHYLGEVGKEVYSLRKKLFSLYSLIPFYIKNYNIDSEKLLQYLNELKSKNSVGLKKMYKTELGDVVRKKQSSWSKLHADEISKRNKELWKDGEYRKRIMKSRDYSYENFGSKIKNFYKDEKNKEFIKTVMNNPDRVKKISIASKKMWDNAKIYPEFYRRMVNSTKNKNCILNGYRMNNIEYQIGVLLNELNLNWEYEKIFNFKKSCFLPDFYVNSKNLIIECYGDFWHGNPKFLNENNFTHKNRKVRDVWEYDKNKKEIFERNGYKYLFFWEDDINDNLIKIKENIYENTR